MNRNIIFPLIALPLLSGSEMKAQDRQEKQPNIVLFLVDDMGWQDTSLPFWTQKTRYNEIYETPNMERLAQRGVKFTSAYACSISSPSRISLFTGMNAARHRVTNWTLEKNKSVDYPSHVLAFPQWNVNGMSPVPGVEYTCHATSLAQVLKDHGYYTIHCGKAHFGAISTPAADPLQIGFDVNIAGHAAGGLASYLGEENYGNRTDGTPSPLFAVPGLKKYWGTDVFVTEALTREAIAALDQRDTVKPFFLYMSHYAIHIPINRDKRYYQKYLDKGLDQTEAAYAGLIEGMDKSLGDLMHYLDENGLTDHTVILFMSDNGGLTASSRSGKLHVQNYPLNSGKGSAYEGGIREPMIVSWPGVTQPNTVCDQYLMIEDFFPSLLEIAGIKKYNTVQSIDGVSFVPMLRGTGRRVDGRKLYWNFPNLWGATGPGIAPTCSIREGDWKLIYYYETGKKELFNIKDDIGETTNLVLMQPRLVAKLSKALGKHLRKVGAQRPVFRATGKATPWPDEVE